MDIEDESIKGLLGQLLKAAGKSAAAPIPPKPIEAYYDTGTKAYYIRSGDTYVPVFKRDLWEHLVNAGWNGHNDDNELLSDTDREILRIQKHNHVEYVGPLAGWKMGFAVSGRTRCLITSEAHPVEPHPGTWPLLRGILEHMLGLEQLPYLYGWIKMALKMYRAHKWMPGQVIFIAGPKDSGKNLLAAVLKHIFGGRAPGKPYDCMTKATTFNSELFGSELLTIEDEAAATRIQERLNFGAEVKKIAVNEEQRYHPKGKPALAIVPYWRVIASLNDEPERLQVIPPITPDIEDKIMLFKALHHPMPMPTATPEERGAFMDALVAELPAFVDFLLQWQIPPELHSPRFGITHYHHPELLANLHAVSPEQKLLELIDEVIFGETRQGPWSGNSTKLDRELKDASKTRCGKEAEKLLPHSNTCGNYLSRLQAKLPDRVSYRNKNGVRIWTIQAPVGRLLSPVPPAPPKPSASLLAKVNALATQSAGTGPSGPP